MNFDKFLNERRKETEMLVEHYNFVEPSFQACDCHSLFKPEGLLNINWSKFHKTPITSIGNIGLSRKVTKALNLKQTSKQYLNECLNRFSQFDLGGDTPDDKKNCFDDGMVSLKVFSDVFGWYKFNDNKEGQLIVRYLFRNKVTFIYLSSEH